MYQLPLLLTLAFVAPEAEPPAAQPESVEVQPGSAPAQQPPAQPVSAEQPGLTDPFTGEPQPTPQGSADLGDPFANAQAQPRAQPQAQPQPGQAGSVGTQQVVYGPPPGPPPEQPARPPSARKLGFFVGFDTRLSEIDRAFGTTLGGLAGLILKQRLMLGGGYYSLAFHDRSYSTLTDSRDLQLDYGGAQIGVYALRSPRVDGGLNVFLGGGQLCLESSTTGSCAAKTGAFVSHVESTVYIRLLSILRLGFGFGYNFIIDTSGRWAGPDNWDMSGWGGAIKIELGLFQPPSGGGRRRR